MKYSELYLHQLFNKCFLRGDYFVIDAYNYIKEDLSLKYGSMWLNCSHVRNKYFYLEISALWYILSILTENY